MLDEKAADDKFFEANEFSTTSNTQVANILDKNAGAEAETAG